MELRAGQHTPRYAASGAYRGVHWRAPASKWEAQICDKGKQRFLGYFHTEVEAARMYDAAASKLQGAAAKLNFPSKSSVGVGLPSLRVAVSSHSLNDNRRTMGSSCVFLIVI